MGKKILKVTLTITTILALLFFSIFYTETLPRLLLQAAESISEGAIEVGKTSGSLSRGFAMKTLVVKGDDFCVSLKDIFIKITPLRLLKGTLFFDFLVADEVIANFQKETKGTENKRKGTQQILLPDLFFDIELKNGRIKRFLIGTAKDESPLAINDLAVSGAFKDKTLNIKYLKGNLLSYHAGFFIEANVSALSQPAALSGRMVLKRKAKGSRQTVIDANFKGDLQRLSLTGKVKGVPQGTFSGLFSDILKKPRWHLVIDLEEFNPSLLDPRSPSTLIQANARLRGENGKVFGLVQGHFTFPQKEKGTFFVKGGFSSKGLLIEKGIFSTLGGRFDISGSLLGDLGFRARAAFDNIHLDPFLPGIKARISGAIKASGTMGGKRGPYADIHLESVHGMLNGKACTLGGDILLKKTEVGLKEIEFKAPGTSLSLTGFLKRASQDIKVVFRSKDLSFLYPALKGKVSINSHVFGKRKDPGVHLYALGSKVSSPAGALKTFKVTLDSDGLLTSQIGAKIDASGLLARGFTLDTLSASLNGTRAKHSIRLRSKAKGFMSDLRLSGSLNQEFNYRGLLRDFKLRLVDSGTWRLLKATRFLAGKERFDIAKLCLLNRKNGGRICIDGEIEKTRAGINVVSSSLPLRPLSDIWGKNFSLSGNFDFRLSFSKDGKSSSGNLFVQTKDAMAFLGRSNKARPLMLTARGRLLREGLQAEVFATLDTKTKVSGHITLPGFLQGKSYAKRQKVEGVFTLSSGDVSMIHDFFPDLYLYDGSLKSKIKFSGTTKNPHLEAMASLLNLKAEYPDYGLLIHLKDASLVLNDHDLDIVALLDSPDGNLKITGKGKVKPRNLDLLFKISGKDYKAVSTPYEKISISPELLVFLKNNQLEVHGTLLVPFARIEGFTPSATAIVPSTDIKIEGEKSNGSRAATNVSLNVNVILGDDVKVKVYGLEGVLKGKIGLKTSRSGEILGTGILSIKDGVYKALETRLEIKKGRLLYFSSPLDNPELEVEAVRKVDDSLVGLRVKGRLKDPVIKLFSDPAMPESEIARYLLGGKKGTGMTKASVIAGGANLLLSRLRQRLGVLDEIKLETGEASDDISLMVGTYLRPDLYLKFINDFEDKVTKFMLRYDYSKHIEIETETGESPSAGIFFKLEK